MKPALRATLALTFTAMSLLAACGDDEGSSGRSYDNKTPAQTHVALFVDTAYVEFDTTDSDQEGSNLYLSLKARGFLVDTFTTTDSTAIAAILADADVLVLPEPENNSYSGLPAGTQSAIRHFVQGGGTVAWFDYADEMNSIFDWSLVYANDSSYDSTIAKNGNILPFTGPDTLPYADATDLIDSSTLPSGTRVLYIAGGDAAVAIIPLGQGEVVFFGYDWFDAAPFGTQDGGWVNLLDGLSKF